MIKLCESDKRNIYYYSENYAYMRHTKELSSVKGKNDAYIRLTGLGKFGCGQYGAGDISDAVIWFEDITVTVI